MRNARTSRYRQRGAVAIMTGLMATVLFAFGGIVLDLGHLYIGKSELQNAADAAALAGAKELNNRLSGVTAAVNRAIAIAAQHRYDFSKPVNITIANIRLGTCPNANNANTFGRPGLRSPTCSFVPASSITSDAQASGLSFLEVDTGTQEFNTYLMRVAGADYNTTSTAGYAVAGRYQTTVTPIGVCAIDPVNRTSKYTHTKDTGTSTFTELVEHGFRRGVTYNLLDLNPLSGGPSDPYLINPVDAYPNACNPHHSSTNFTAPFVCTGSSAVMSGGGGKVYANTGMSASIEASLNSRFAIYSGPSKCASESAPPDSNVMPYRCKVNSFPGCGVPPPPLNSSPPIDWMAPAGGSIPSREFVATGANSKPLYKLPPTSSKPDLEFESYGVLWSYSPAVYADSSTPPKKAGPIPISEANDSDMYSKTDIPRPYFTNNYPLAAGTGFLAGTAAAPYNQDPSSSYFKSPPSHFGLGVPNRRVLNLALIDCTAPVTGSGACAAIDVVAIGKFFMQVPADFTTGKRQLSVEFAGLIEQIPSSDIRLYR